MSYDELEVHCTEDWNVARVANRITCWVIVHVTIEHWGSDKAIFRDNTQLVHNMYFDLIHHVFWW